MSLNLFNRSNKTKSIHDLSIVCNCLQLSPASNVQQHSWRIISIEFLKDNMVVSLIATLVLYARTRCCTQQSSVFASIVYVSSRLCTAWQEVPYQTKSDFSQYFVPTFWWLYCILLNCVVDILKLENSYKGNSIQHKGNSLNWMKL